jgi:HSP20 family protein
MLVRFRNIPSVTSFADNIFNLERNIDNAFTDMLGRDTFIRRDIYPLVDLAEYENESIVVAEMPGVMKEDLKISIDNGYLSISGERKPSNLPEGSSWVRNEIGTGKFTRAIELPHEVDANRISAELNNGVLRIVLPKAERIRPREIRIK